MHNFAVLLDISYNLPTCASFPNLSTWKMEKTNTLKEHEIVLLCYVSRSELSSVFSRSSVPTVVMNTRKTSVCALALLNVLSKMQNSKIWCNLTIYLVSVLLHQWHSFMLTFPMQFGGSCSKMNFLTVS